ncbi:transposase [Cupriavidus sp. CP313]
MHWQAGEPGTPTVVVLDNAKIHHGIDEAILHRWLIDHHTLLLHLPAYSPELNLVEIVWRHAKYHWRRFVTWTPDTIDAEIAQLLGAYGSKFEVRFS